MYSHIQLQFRINNNTHSSFIAKVITIVEEFLLSKMEDPEVLQTRYYQFTSEEVITDFSFKAYDALTDDKYPGVQRTADNSLEGRTANYTKYDLFCFNTKLAEKIRSINPEVSHILNPKQYKDRIHMCVQLQRGQTQIPITITWKERLDRMASEAMTEMPGKFLFFSAHFDLPMDGVVMKSTWLRSIIHRIHLSQNINYDNLELFTLDPEVVNGRVYMQLHPDTDYRADEAVFKLSLLNRLVYLYHKGVIALSLDNPLIDKWQLELIELDLYAANWTNVLFAKNKCEFLQRLLVENNIEICVPTDDVMRQRITQKMPYKSQFTSNAVLVFVDNLDDALKASAIVMQSLRYKSSDHESYP